MTCSTESKIAWILWNLSEELSRLLRDIYEDDFESFMEDEARHRHTNSTLPFKRYPTDIPF